MTRSDVVMTVIRYLGRIAILLAVGFLALTGYVLWLAGKAGQVDPVAVGAVGAVGSALTFVLGALGAMLVSVKSGPDETDALPVTGPGGGPVETVEADPTGSGAPDAALEPVAESRPVGRRVRASS